MGTISIRGGAILLEDRIVKDARVVVDGARIVAIETETDSAKGPGQQIAYLDMPDGLYTSCGQE